MVRVAPVKGITYNFEKVKQEEVIAPPYDVIPSEEQQKLYNLSDYNIVRLILGKIFPEDTEANSRYTRASEYFTKWLEEGVLTKSEKPCIYYYVQNYTINDENSISRKGFIAKNLVEEYDRGNVLPHEFTMGGPKEDRLKLMKACNANFSQIFMTYSDPDGEIDKAVKLPEKPLIDVKDDQGIQNLIYVIDDEEVVNKVVKLMEDKKVLIADGHHRYETSIAYRDYRREQNPGWKEEDGFNWVMAFYTNLDDPNLKVYPTHRIVTREVDTAILLEDLKKYFDIAEYKFDDSTREDVKEKLISDIEEISKTRIAFGTCFKGENLYRLFKLREQDQINQILEEKQVPGVMKKLDLTVLHKIILSDFLCFSEDEQLRQDGVKYLKKMAEAFEAIENKKAEVVFIMATPHIHLIKEISSAGYKMPQKSTYFYPKLTSGLVINPL